jgi:hypothetical protein
MVEEKEDTWLPTANISLSVLKNKKLYHHLLLLVVMLDGIRKHFHAWYMLSSTDKKTWKNIYGVGVSCVRPKSGNVLGFWPTQGASIWNIRRQLGLECWRYGPWEVAVVDSHNLNHLLQSEPSSRSFLLSLLCCMYIYSEPMCRVFCFYIW